MPHVQDSLASAAYALFALQQPLSLAEIAGGARAGQFPSAATSTPDWFAAAAEDSSLVDMAPELQVLPADLEAADRVDVSGIDLIHVYAPELKSVEELEDVDDEAAETAAAPAPRAEQPRTSTQLGLLKELGNLDA
jgi:hypothetical protein